MFEDRLDENRKFIPLNIAVLRSLTGVVVVGLVVAEW